MSIEEQKKNLGMGNQYHKDKDFARADGCYLNAAEQGYVPAQNNVGRMYRKGLGVKQNNREAVSWYRKAAKQGYDTSQNKKIS